VDESKNNKRHHPVCGNQRAVHPGDEWILGAELALHRGGLRTVASGMIAGRGGTTVVTDLPAGNVLVGLLARSSRSNDVELANDPGGTRWVRLLDDDAAELFMPRLMQRKTHLIATENDHTAKEES
jgi:hypothetical protein